MATGFKILLDFFAERQIASMINKECEIKVSVIVPIYNGKKTIKKCLDSIVNQSLKEIEIICINDGSTDGTQSILEEYVEKEARIIVINIENGGYGHAVNIGLDRAKGKYIGIVESDDFIKREMFAELYKLSEIEDADVIKGNFYNYFFDVLTAREKYEPDAERNGVTQLDRAFTLIENPEILWGHPSVWSAIYKKVFLHDKHIRMIEDNIGGWEDNLFFHETLCKAKKIRWINSPLYYYWRDNPESSSNKAKNYLLPFIRMNQNIEILEKNNCTSDSIKVRAYARALMYVRGAVASEDFPLHKREILEHSAELLRKLDENIFLNYFNQYDQKTYYQYCSPIPAATAGIIHSKILIYNWLPFDNPWNWGGGVTIYCKNIIQEMLKEYPSVEIYFLSSGFAYMANKETTFVRKIGNMFGDQVQQFEIVNSPVPAEQRWLYKNPLVALENKSLKKIIGEFIEKYGPFQAIHFNNLEGLSLDIFDLKEVLPKTKFIFSIHNYVSMCVNGSYYMRHRHCNCNPYHTGQDCYQCTRADMRSNFSIEQYKRGLYDVNAGECISQNRWIQALKMERLDEDVSAENILLFEKTAKEKINKNCDHILAVSKRVYEIAKENGIDESKMQVSYIGTQIAERQIRRPRTQATDIMRIVFLGSDINYEEKGFPFLLDALNKMPEKYAARIEIVLTVKQAEHAEIYSMLKNFRSVKVKQGYTHAELPMLFEGANLSIVPVLWEDNLPQIAIESVAFGVPVLASSAGGASELSDSDLFCFKCGDAEDMLSKIIHFLDKPEELYTYWEHHHGLVTMEQHVRELVSLYGIRLQKDFVQIAPKDWRWLVKENNYLRTLSVSNPKSHTTNLLLEDLKRKLAHEQNRKGDKNMECIEGKLIFQNEIEGIIDNPGANLFKLTLPDFNYSDFFAEIRFVKLGNVEISLADTLRISGTWHEVTEESWVLDIHQFKWLSDDPKMQDWISVYVRNNEIYFWGKYAGRSAGYYYEIRTLTSRAEKDAIGYTALNAKICQKLDKIPVDNVYIQIY